jgi:hypothetical protein
MAVKAEVQTSVLPALENITRIEVRSALNEHVGGGIANYIQQVSLTPALFYTQTNHSTL